VKTHWTLAAVAGLLIETASRDLSTVAGAFGLSSAEWSILAFSAGICVALIAAWLGERTENELG
jgi:hypothetical protein